MTPAWIARLAESAGALGVSLDADAAQRLGRFADLLEVWGARMDLSSIRDPDEVREKHFVDSLAGLRVVRGPGLFVDFGSGAGFPGLVLAIARPELEVLSVESRSKKGVFQRQVLRELKIENASVITARAEDVIRETPAPTWIGARALTDLAGLVTLARPWLDAGATLVAWKSSKVEAEIAAAGLEGLVVERDEFALPESGDPRTLVSVRAAREAA